MAERREVKVTEEQKIVLLEFMNQHLDFSYGKLLKANKRQIWQSLWMDLAKRLNSTAGPKKNITKWQRVWVDLKNKIKRKASGLGIGKKKGVNSVLNTEFTEFEERLVSFLGRAALNELEDSDNECEKPLGTYDSLLPSTSAAQSMVSFVKTDIVPQEIIVNLEVYSDKCITTTTVIGDPIETVSSTETTKQSKTDKAISQFSADLNRLMNTVNATLAKLVEERRETNNLLTEIVSAIKERNNET